MIISVEDLKIKYANYTDVNGKIKRDIDESKIFPLVRGLYTTDENTSKIALANYIYGPSYISFEMALSIHGMIPESVYTFTSATFNKRKIKRYSNHFGYYIYRDVPKEVYPYGIEICKDNGYSYQVASKEKALCDKLYIMPPITNQKELREMLFEDLRIEPEVLNELNKEDLIFIAEKYHSKNLDLLIKVVRRFECNK